MASITWEFLDTIVVVAHSPAPLSDEDFSAFQQAMNTTSGLTGIVVLAHDSPPAARHREVIRDWFKRTQARGAVLTDSLVARGAVTALSWFGVPMHAYGRRDFVPALEFVRVRPQYLDAAIALLDELERRTSPRRSE